MNAYTYMCVCVYIYIYIYINSKNAASHSCVIGFRRRHVRALEEVALLRRQPQEAHGAQGCLSSDAEGRPKSTQKGTLSRRRKAP